MISISRQSAAVLALVLFPLTTPLSADESALPPSSQADWPQEVEVMVGEIRTRLDGPKLWTLSGIDFRETMIATEDSAYGTVLTIRDVGHLGTAHFLDVPGKPGEVEKEIVTELRMVMDDRPVERFAPRMKLEGKNFRFERKSKIRSLDLETTITIRDGVLTETAHFRVRGPLDLRVAYPWMYAWTPEATDYVFGDDQGIPGKGEFRREGSTTTQVVKDATWLAVFDAEAGQGAVCRFAKAPKEAEASFLLVDAPGVYRKLAGYTLEDRRLDDGFEGEYQAIVGFFVANSEDWPERAKRRAAELKNNAPNQ